MFVVTAYGRVAHGPAEKNFLAVGVANADAAP